MSEDFRITLTLASGEHGLGLMAGLRELRVEREARQRLGDRVVVSADGPRLFLYADTDPAAREARRVVEGLLAERGLRALDARVERWHPDAEEWEDLDAPLPDTPEERAAEHADQGEQDVEQTREQGFAEWEVRVELPSHGATVELADQLEREGIPVVRRWTFLLIGAPTEDDARALAERVRAEAPEGTEVEAELSGAAVWRATDPYPFAVMGGLGG